jgi:flagellar biosynthesis/type III secretory pathway M-ring protein FliF/YscJ
MLKQCISGIALLCMAGAVACADDQSSVDGIQEDILLGNNIAALESAAASNESIAVGRVETTVNVTPVDNSIRQLAVMVGNVQALSVAVVVGSENLNATSGNGNGSVGGGLTISSVGAANSVSAITTSIPATIAPK